MSPSTIFKSVVLGIVALVGLSVVTGSFYTVDEGERAVVVTQGKVAGVSEPGFHWKAPFISDAHVVSLRDGLAEYSEVQAYTRDAQVATVHRISVSYRVKPSEVIEVYTRYGTAENAVRQMVDRRISESLEQVFGQFTADTAIQKRAELGTAFASKIRQLDGPVEIVGVQIENFSLPKEYEQNVTDKMKQEVEVKKLEQRELQEQINARIAVTKAQAEADSQLAVATANAKAVELAGAAEASAIRAKSDALRESPNLVELTKAERWDGKFPTTMIPGGAMPFLNIK